MTQRQMPMLMVAATAASFVVFLIARLLGR
jgi:uncharacterized membrane protein YdjX (TVP38/TMEM64 family)